jgi:hypothetical protein
MLSVRDSIAMRVYGSRMMRKCGSTLITHSRVVRFGLPLTLLVLLAVAAMAGLSACGSSPDKEASVDGGMTYYPDGSFPVDTGFHLLGDGSSDGSGYDFDVEPSAMQTITVPMGQTSPTVAYTATLNGVPASASWSVDTGNLGSIGAGPSSTATFTPTGTTGGLATIRVTAMGLTVQRQVFIKITASSNGASTNPADSSQIVTSLAQLGSGGGVGGVGGEGLGGPVTNMPTLTALQNPGQNGQAVGLQFLYPYDQTVFPRSMLAPLLQWQWTPPDGGVDDADAILISLVTTSGSFSWTGTFSAPAILQQSGGTFIRQPIPQDVWTTATNTAGGPTPSGALDKLTVSLVIAKAGQGYGPITETWIIAPGRLEGTVYYNSYGTALVKNSLDSDYNGNEYGAAVLGIVSGATGPVVVAGTASPPGAGTGCRVCHVVAAGGSMLIAQHGDDYYETSTYNLQNNNAETPLTGYDGTFGWAGLYPDGTMAFTNSADLAAGTPNAQLYAFPPTTMPPPPLPVTGIPANLQAGTPVFSPDGNHIAFGFLGGTIGTTTGNDTMLAAMDFTPPGMATDAGAEAGAEGGTPANFSNLKILVTMPSGERAGFPTFFPTNDAVAFHYQIVNSNHEYNTWHGAEAQIWWSDLATGTPSNLFTLNGLKSDGVTSYLPTGGTNHGNDTVLNYEPTVSPISSGGYIWVIFTSRRLYGNVATTDPWQSDPRNYNASIVANATTKKLWVAAIDLNAPPGTDPSHPAFYLPAQELLAGNMRGFWVLNPCLSDSMSCSAGDQCCSGYCRSVESNDAGLSCTTVPPLSSCSHVGEKCAMSSDCCDMQNSCVDGFCSVPTPQ